MADSKEVRRAKLKTAAALRAKLAYEQSMDRVDHRLDVIDPAIDAIDAQVAQGKPIRQIGPGK
jgi:hypothetical protein